ncbi:MAG: response regulator [Bacteroidales bacterium]
MNATQKPERALLSGITGDTRTFAYDHRLQNMVLFAAGIAASLFLLAKILSGDTTFLTFIVTGFLILFVLGNYVACRFFNKFTLTKWLSSLILFPVFTFSFILENGSDGHILYLFMVYFMILMVSWNGRDRFVFLGVFVANVAVLYFIESRHPEWLRDFHNEGSRLLFLFGMFLLYSAVGALVIVAVKQSYIRERLKAIKSDKLKSSFLANMSHEIRTPMNAIIGFSQLLHNELDEDSKSMYIRAIQDNSQSLLRLIEDIIDLSKIEAGYLDIHPGPVDLPRMCEELKQTFEPIVHIEKEGAVSIRCIPPDGVTRVVTDGPRLRQVLTNLLQNAVKFTDEGEITFGCEPKENELLFFVKDSGSGIRADLLTEIFDRFRKLEDEGFAKNYRGAGLGLSISKNLVTLLGGRIWAESQLGEGSEFYFTLPWRPAPGEEPRPVAASPKISKQVRRKTVLIAEDEADNFHLLKIILKEYHVTVHWARTGPETLEMLRELPRVDLILMDLHMPEMSGLEVTRRIRRTDPALPIIAQTARAMDGDRTKCMEAGCTDYLSKPILPEAFRTMMNKYLG